jgi:diguanylate cyclase (GGDEF)-like protein
MDFTADRALVTMLLVQQGLVAGAWWLGSLLGVERSAARHWAASSLLLAATAAALIWRATDTLPAWAAVLAPNLLGLLAFVALRRGIERHAGEAPADREHLVLVLGLAAVIVVAAAAGPAWPWIMGATALAYAFTLLRAAALMRRTLSARAGAVVAWGCSVPLFVLGGLLMLRAASVALAAAQGADFARRDSGPQEGDADTMLLMAFLAVCQVLNLALAALVVQALISRLRHLTHHDPLTGLLNRRGMQALFEAEHRRCRGTREGLCLLAVDIDHFKRINDVHGHAAGDAVLAGVAGVMQRAVRDVDLCARMGGEEFCLLLVRADGPTAHDIAARLMAAVREHRFTVPGVAQPLAVTVSIGVVAGADASVPLEALLSRVDAALYRAKASGRDRIEWAAGPHAAPA